MKQYVRDDVVDTKVAAEFCYESIEMMMRWRKNKKGPKFTKNLDRTITYVIGDLNDYMRENYNPREVECQFP